RGDIFDLRNRVRDALPMYEFDRPMPILTQAVAKGRREHCRRQKQDEQDCGDETLQAFSCA
ncbi:MAG TPA: hypothetical protein PKE16_15445, partial [Hyphomicrobium sp.]|nr:hypothetical protein [Hyphomicrobium sp.]